MDITAVGELKGTITAPARLTGKIEQLNTLVGTIDISPNQVASGQLKAVISNTVELVGKISGAAAIKGSLAIPTAAETPVYNGSYEITPRVDEQVLETRSKTMRDDLTVLAIPYYETSNPTGKTVYIGGE